MANAVRIIGGEWRSRQITFDDAPGLRPTPARVRETLFNWLQADIGNSCCLDLFAGSGALGFEAASRGARRVVQVESNLQSCRQLRANVERLNASQIQVRQADVLKFLADCEESFDLVFLDPPFGQGLILQTCQSLCGAVLAPHAKIYIEAERQFAWDNLPSSWRLLKQKTAGDVSYALVQQESVS